MFRGKISPRRVLRLISLLPEESAFVASVAFHAKPDRKVRHDPSLHDWRGWGTDRQLLATLVDAINLNTRLTGQWAKKSDAPKFEPYPRPSKRPAHRPVMSLADLAKQIQK